MCYLCIYRGVLNNISWHHLLILGDDMERDWLMFSQLSRRIMVSWVGVDEIIASFHCTGLIKGYFQRLALHYLHLVLLLSMKMRLRNMSRNRHRLRNLMKLWNIFRIFSLIKRGPFKMLIFCYFFEISLSPSIRIMLYFNVFELIGDFRISIEQVQGLPIIVLFLFSGIHMLGMERAGRAIVAAAMVKSRQAIRFLHVPL